MKGDIKDAKRRLPLPELMRRLGLPEHAKKSARCPFHEAVLGAASVMKSRPKWRRQSERTAAAGGTGTKRKKYMKSYKLYRNSSYLKKEDFPAPQVLTIQAVREERIPAPGADSKTKLAIYFEELDRGLVCNMTNGDTLSAISGSDDPDNWVGLKIEAYWDKSVSYAGKTVGGIRLRNVEDPPVVVVK